MRADTGSVGAVIAGTPRASLPRGPQDELPDEHLAALVHAGNESAFDTLYARYRVPLGRYCRSILGEAEDAGDALQNTMIAALGALRQRPLTGRVKPWLYRIAHNESITVMRRRRGHEPLEEDTAWAEPAADRLANWQALVADLRVLPERQRAALLMRELAGLEYDEIGTAFEISAGAARKAVFEARSSLTTFAVGRDTACATIRERISAGDRRALRAREMRAHLDGCSACHAFAHELERRRAVLATVPALPATAALAGFGLSSAGAGAGAGGASLLGGIGGALLSGSGGSALVKGLAVCAVCALAGGGVIDALPHHAQPPAPVAGVVHAARSHAGRSGAAHLHRRAASERRRALARHEAAAARRIAARSASATRPRIIGVVAERPVSRPARLPHLHAGAGRTRSTSVTTPAPSTRAASPTSTSATTPAATSTTPTATAPVAHNNKYDPYAALTAPVRALVTTVINGGDQAASSSVSSAAESLQALLNGNTLSTAARTQITAALSTMLPDSQTTGTSPEGSATAASAAPANPLASLLHTLFANFSK